MIDPDAFADLLCDWSMQVRESDTVLIATSTLAEPLVRAVHRAVLTRGAWPAVRVSPAGLLEDFYRLARDEQLDGFSPIELAEVQAADAVLRIDAPHNTRALAAIDPSRILRATRARSPLQEIRMTLRWCGTIWPTPALAQQAGMNTDDYARFLTGALFLDRPDPAGAWRALDESQAGLVERLAGAREIRIEAEGTDLRLRVDGRTWVNSNGRHNMPSGEVFTGPLEDSANGTIRFSVPSVSRGVEVANVELTFERGEVVRATAERGQAYLDAALATDPGARFLGELGIGTNAGIDRATGSTLLDEKMAGTVHLALGRSYKQTGGRNASALHWDLICDLRQGGRLTADGEPIELATAP